MQTNCELQRLPGSFYCARHGGTTEIDDDPGDPFDEHDHAARLAHLDQLDHAEDAAA